MQLQWAAPQCKCNEATVHLDANAFQCTRDAVHLDADASRCIGDAQKVHNAKLNFGSYDGVITRSNVQDKALPCFCEHLGT